MAEPHAETTATTEHGAGGGEAHAAPSAFGLTAPMFIGLAMLVVIALMLWKKVPAAIGKALDKQIDLIRSQLSEAEALRKEAEAAQKDADALIERARHEADAMLVKAKADAEALVARRGRMAEDKIAAEERAAVDQLRATAAEAARRAAAKLITERLDDQADKALVDQAIGGLNR